MKHITKALILMVILANLLYSEGNVDQNLKMLDADFTKNNFEESLLGLRKELPERLINSKNRNGLIDGSEFWITYYNSLKYIEGYTLKKEAELEKLSGKGVVAQKRYARFLKEAQLSD